MSESEDPKESSNNDLRNAQFGGGFINAENVNAGRIGGDIWNFFFGQQTTTPVGNPARPKNEQILLAAVKEEVTARLRQSLHNAVLINLEKESQPQQVKRPWDAEIKIGLKPAVLLRDTTTILEVFDSEEIAGKLLILGAPGSGKTTTQLELAQALISRAEEQPDYPVPVLFNLSSWKHDRQSMTDWLVAELKSKYGVSKKLGQEWAENHQLLPLLDGLDELESQRQESCVQAINQLLQEECRPLYLVVCSRNEEYNNFETKLQLNGAIRLHPLTENQICKYLADVKYADLWHFILNDHDLLELTKVPLLLSIVVLAYQEIFINSWGNINEERWDNINAQGWMQISSSSSFNLQNLLDTYVRRMLTREVNSSKKPQLTVRQNLLWLVWLAQQLQKTSQTEFLIEKIQPNWLDKTSYRLYKILVFIFYELIYGVLVWLIYDAIFGIICGIITVIILFGIELIKPFETIIWSWEKAKYSFKKALVFGLIAGIIVSSFFWLLEGLELFYSIISGLSVTLVVVLSTVVFLGVSNFDIQTKNIPNQGIWESAKNTVVFTLIVSCPIWTLGYLLFLVVRSSLEPKLSNFPIYLNTTYTITDLLSLDITKPSLLLFGIIPGLGFGIGYAGLSCIQHFTLRFILYLNGYIPWNYARFLNYCTERMLLQRVGGRYRFIHKLLQDHFAQMEFKRD